jgi:hypothetical protein
MSEALEGIWFPIANDHHPHNPISDQPADDIQAKISPQTIPDKSGVNRKPPIRLAVADGNKPTINPQETPSDNRQTSIRPGYWSPIGSQAKAALVDGYTQLVTDRVQAGWSCHLVTILFSQLPGTRSTIISHEERGPPRLLRARVYPSAWFPPFVGDLGGAIHQFINGNSTHGTVKDILHSRFEMPTNFPEASTRDTALEAACAYRPKLLRWGCSTWADLGLHRGLMNFGAVFIDHDHTTCLSPSRSMAICCAKKFALVWRLCHFRNQGPQGPQA